MPMHMNSSLEGIHLLDDSKSAPTKPAASSHTRVRRRNRMITSCLECRRRKLKCDRLHPCTNCSKFTRDCVFLAPALDSASQMKLTEIKEKMGSLERVLEKDVARKKKDSSGPSKERQADRRSSADLPGGDESNSDEAPVPEDEKDLEPTPLAVMDAAFEDDTNDDILDLGVKMGKLRLTERIGGFFRPKMTEELAFTLSDPSIDYRTEEEKNSYDPFSSGSTEEFLEPGPTYIAPSAGFLFSDSGSSKLLLDYLPSKPAACQLVDQYLKACHYINKVVHWPSFQVQFENFWTNINLGIEPAPAVQALIFSVMFAAVASMDDFVIEAVFSRPKRTVLTNLQLGTEVALEKAHFLRSTKIEVVQALVIYLIPMCCAEMSRAHSVLVGTAIRLAECMGMHRDPQVTYGLGPIEAHVRRMVWYQLCFLDMRATEAQGPRPIIRREDFDTKLPFNVNDADLLSGEPKDSDTTFTDMTISRMRFECAEMHRVMFIDRQRLEKKQVSLTHVLGKIESFRKAMEAKYNAILDTKVPVQLWASLVLNILLLRMHIGVLHRYHNSVSVRIPDRLRQIIITSGTQLTEDAMKLETLPELKPWRWYSGAIQQYHTALLLLVEIFAYPHRKEADRIWNIIDYVFETTHSQSRAQKGRVILSQLRDKTAIYRDIRKIRAPVTITKRLYHTNAPERTAEVGSDTFEIPPPNSLRSDGEHDLRLLPRAESKIALDYVSSQAYISSAAGPHPGAMDSPPKSADPKLDNWSFDTPATYLFNKTYTRMDTMPRLAQAQKKSLLVPSIDPTSSPSAISSDDSWPPYITQNQGGWENLVAPTSTAQQQQRPIPMAVLAMETSAAPPVVDSEGNSYSRQDNASVPDLMMEIDWNEWDKIFPPDINTGVLDMPSTSF